MAVALVVSLPIIGLAHCRIVIVVGLVRVVDAVFEFLLLAGHQGGTIVELA